MRLTYLPLSLLATLSLCACGDDDSSTGSDAQVFMDGKVTRDDGGMLMMECPGGCEEGLTCMAGQCVALGVQKKCGCVDGDAGDGETCYPEYGVFSDDKTILFVKAGAVEGDGSLDAPFATIGSAVTSAVSTNNADVTIAIAAGTYPEDVTVERETGSANVDLFCACADSARIEGQVRMGRGVPNGRIDGCTVVPKLGGSEPPFDLQSPSWPQDCSSDNNSVGITINPSVAGGFEITNSIVAGFCTGVRINTTPDSNGSQLCIHASRVCANDVGVLIYGAPGISPGVGACQALNYGASLSQSVIDQNKTYGIRAERSSETLGLARSAVLLTGVLGQQASGEDAYGLYLGNLQEAVISGSLIAQNAGIGMTAINLACEDGQRVCPGGGQDCPDEQKVCPLAAEVIEITNNEVLQNVGGGIALQQLQATQPVVIEGNLIANTLSFDDAQRVGGDGLQVTVEGGTSFNVSILNNLIDASARDGILLDGVGGAIDGNTITSSGEYGVLLQNSGALIQTNTISLSGTLDQNITTEILHDPVFMPMPMP